MQKSAAQDRDGWREVICNNNKVQMKYTVGHKKRDTLLLSISSPIIDRLKNFFTSALYK